MPKRVVGKEKYFTDTDEAFRCVQFTNELFDLDQFSLIVEPSAGTGSFLAHLPTTNTVGIDIEPQHPNITNVNFLDWVVPATKGSCLVIGNPPFGQRASLAFRFMDKACLFADVIGFVLPQSFKKYTFQNRVHPSFHLVSQMDCEEDYRDDRGLHHSVKTVFQVWERRGVKREQIILASTHPDFHMRHCHLSRTSQDQLKTIRNTYAFAIPQVGSNFTTRNVETVDKGSYWFVKPNVPGVRDRFNLMDFGFLDGMNVAHKSLSKKDIIMAYQNVKEGKQ